MKTIKYTKKDSTVSTRNILVISEPKHNLFAIDLTEFAEQEQEFYAEEFTRLHEDYLEAIRDLGLGSCYRQFKPEGVEYVS